MVVRINGIETTMRINFSTPTTLQILSAANVRHQGHLARLAACCGDGGHRLGARLERELPKIIARRPARQLTLLPLLRHLWQKTGTRTYEEESTLLQRGPARVRSYRLPSQEEAEKARGR